MLQVLLFEAATLLYLAFPKYSCFVHLQYCISKYSALRSESLSHHEAVGKLSLFASLQRGLCKPAAVLLILFICCSISDLDYYKYIFIYSASLQNHGLGKQDIHL